MQPTKLFVIGNGFDLHHGIRSGYKHFCAFVQAQDRAVFDAVERYLPADGDGTNGKWSDMEAALGKLSPDEVIEDLGHFMASYADDDWSDSGHHDFQYEVGRLAERLSAELRRLFGLWIRQLKIPAQIPLDQALQVLDPTAIFFSFNYTTTLIQAYGVPLEQITYIHGCADQVDQHLILGHARKPRSLNDRPDLAELDTRLVEVNDILDNYFDNTFKPSDQIIQAHPTFFDRLLSVQEVYVLGHSLEDVDAPYYKKMLLNTSVRQANFHLAIHDPKEMPGMLKRLIGLGVPATQIQTHSWAELCAPRPT